MEMEAKKELMRAYTLKLEKQIDKEKYVLRELEDDNATLKYIENQKQSGVMLENSVYEDYETWIENIKKEIKVGESTLKNIAFKKVELEAVKLFVAQAS